MFQIQHANSLLDDFALTDRPEVNLLRSGALYILQTDMSKMPVMILICYAVLPRSRSCEGTDSRCDAASL